MWRYLALLTALVVVAPLPAKVGYLVGRIVADTTFLLAKSPRSGVSSNVRRALGPSPDERLVNHVALEVFRNTARNFYDLIALPRIQPASAEGKLTVQGWHHFEKVLAQGKGVLLTSVHMGNMDMSVQVIKARGVNLTVLTEVIEPPQFHLLNCKLRESHGISLLPVTYSGLKEAIRRLRRGEVVAIASDRAIQGSGVLTKFFGEETLLPTGWAELAYRTGAAVLPAFALRQGGDRFAFYFEPAMYLPRAAEKDRVIRQALDKMVVYMEHYIRRSPEQWMVFERLWTGDAQGAFKAAALVDGRRQFARWRTGARLQADGHQKEGQPTDWVPTRWP